ncbi:RNA methyltransferase [Mycoplasmatota bacterium]|nr:RNA methyltransferase [Mycoplasmatota bacterium]
MIKIILEGFISIKAAINGNNRVIEKIYISNKKRTRKTSFMKKLALKNEISFEFVSHDKIDEIAEGKTHGGFIAFVSERRFNSIESILSSNSCFYVDGIEDPFNLGIIIRTLYSAGVNSLIIRKRDLELGSSRISKSSAGAFEKMDIAMCDDQVETINLLKKSGFKIYAAAIEEKSESLFNVKFSDKSLIIIGGEKRGIQSEVLSLADMLVHIPYGNEKFSYSLPASVASTIFSYEILRQRLEK